MLRDEQKELLTELINYENSNVKLYIGGTRVKPSVRLVDTLLSESCTYMRSYDVRDGRLRKIDFNKIE